MLYSFAVHIRRQTKGTSAMGKITAICISEKRGTAKHPADSAVFTAGHGIEGDAHAGNWHRQVSMLSYEDIEEFNRMGGGVADGDFGENLVVSGLELSELAPGSRLVSGTVVLEVTQRGKECHNDCEIKKRVGRCIMPENGIFARVLHGGTVRKGDKISIE